jgi:MOSC domain-containing protein YiiM
MQVISVNVGQPRQVAWRGKQISTAIFKEPVQGSVRVGSLNLDGDGQADLKVHGGVDQAVYLYPAEHYDFWRDEYPDLDMPWGMFGENLTARGLLEADTNVGDRLRVGTTELVVTGPRIPCFKLGIRFGRGDVVKKLAQSSRTGVYLRVAGEGDVEAGDPIELIARHPDGLAVPEVTRLYLHDTDDLEGLRRAVRVQALPAGWIAEFRQRIAKLEAGTTRP